MSGVDNDGDDDDGENDHKKNNSRNCCDTFRKISETLREITRIREKLQDSARNSETLVEK